MKEYSKLGSKFNLDEINIFLKTNISHTKKEKDNLNRSILIKQMCSQKFSDNNYDKKINQKLQSRETLSVNFTKYVDRE